MAKKPAKGWTPVTLPRRLDMWNIRGEDKVNGYMWYNISATTRIIQWIRGQEKELWNQPYRGEYQEDKIDIREDLLVLIKLKFGV